MATSLQNRVIRLRARKSDPDTGRFVRLRNATLAKSESKFDSSQEAKDYVSESMDPVDADYTAKTFAESKRIENHIAGACETAGIEVSFRNQGSATNDTHIKVFSDVDLLTIIEKFFTVKQPLVVTNPYSGNPIHDLKDLRKIIAARLNTSFPEAKVDTSGPKAIRISGGSLKREIDIIPANWYETVTYRESGDEIHRGVQILDLKGPKRIANFPFLHNYELDSKDRASVGSLKKIIRFVKSAKYDSDEKETIKVSSYDICSICYHVPTSELLQARGDELSLALAFLKFSSKLESSEAARTNLYVPNKTRPIFGAEGVSVGELSRLNSEVFTILNQAVASKGVY